MPFPLAHPAAVLPLQRYCPKYLSYPALIVGSICPDAGYCFGNAGEFSHKLVGSFGFSLPVGSLVLLCLYGIILPAIERLPDRYRRVVPPMALRPLGPPLVVLFSLLVGAWTHLFLDAFTHTGGWFVERLPVLQTTLYSLAGRSVRVCHFLWYASSFAGVILLFLAYDYWRQTTNSDASWPSAKPNWRIAILLAFLVLPIELIHHLVHGALGRYLVAALTVALGIGIALRVTPAERIDGH